MDDNGITTTTGERFTGTDHAILAALMLLRVGGDRAAALAGWHGLLTNRCSEEDFMELAAHGSNLLPTYRSMWNRS